MRIEGHRARNPAGSGSEDTPRIMAQSSNPVHHGPARLATSRSEARRYKLAPAPQAQAHAEVDMVDFVCGTGGLGGAGDRSPSFRRCSRRGSDRQRRRRYTPPHGRRSRAPSILRGAPPSAVAVPHHLTTTLRPTLDAVAVAGVEVFFVLAACSRPRSSTG